MRRAQVRPQARVDMLEIWHFIARDSVQNADRVTQKIEATIRGLAEMPGKGHVRADVKATSLRFYSVYSYVIAYEYDDNVLDIVRVVHGRRNFRKLFKR